MTYNSINIKGGEFIGGVLYLASPTTLYRVSNLNALGTYTTWSVTGLTHIRGIAEFNGRMIVNEEGWPAIIRSAQPPGHLTVHLVIGHIRQQPGMGCVSGVVVGESGGHRVSYLHIVSDGHDRDRHLDCDESGHERPTLLSPLPDRE